MKNEKDNKYANIGSYIAQTYLMKCCVTQFLIIAE